MLAGGMVWSSLCGAESGAMPGASPLASPERYEYAPTLPAAVEAAWQRATIAREAEAMQMRATADKEAVRRPWAAPPSIEAMHRDDRLQSNAGRRETELAIAWPMWLPGQRSANEAMSQAGLDRADSSVRAARLQVAGLVREGAWRLIGDAANRALLERQSDVLHKLYLDVERRVKAGDLARADALAARAQWLESRARISSAEQRLDESRIRWHELTGLQAAPSRQAMTESIDSTTARADHPRLDDAGKGVEHARRRWDVVRASTREPPELKLGVRQDVSGGAGGSHNSLQVGVRIPFATLDRNRPLEAAAIGDLAVAQAVEQRLRQQLQADASAAHVALSSAEQQLLVEQERAKLLRERAQLIDRSFRAGESALPELLRAMDTASQAEAAALRQAIVLEHSRARLQQAIGVLP